MRRVIVMTALALLVLAAAAPATAAGAEHDDFFGLYFPAGMPGTGTTCPGVWVDPFFCVLDPLDPTNLTVLPSGHIQIRDMELYELALSWNDQGVEARKTGYDIVVANANLDGTLTGPTWGTWNLYSFENELMFSGTFTGMFEDGIPAVHFVGRGTGDYEGQHMYGDIGRVLNPYNMYGWILEPGSL